MIGTMMGIPWNCGTLRLHRRDGDVVNDDMY
jgi:hypothetical protein